MVHDPSTGGSDFHTGLAYAGGMAEQYRYDVEILHLLVSPAHAYFGRARDGAADVPTFDAETAEVVTGKGIVGDRFFGKAAHMDAAVTLFAVEALETMAAELEAGPFDPLATRRNVILRGAHLAPLLGQDFALESRGSVVGFHGGRPAHPCAWMNEVLAPGAHAAMRGRGGIRCRALSDGILHRGPAVLVSPVLLDPGQAGVPSLLRPSRLP
jgi:MOSC domain-containing protein YiiM